MDEAEKDPEEKVAVAVAETAVVASGVEGEADIDCVRLLESVFTAAAKVTTSYRSYHWLSEGKNTRRGGGSG